MSMELARATNTLAGWSFKWAKVTIWERPGANTQVAVTVAAVRATGLLTDMLESAIRFVSLISLTFKAKVRVSGIRAIKEICELFDPRAAVGDSNLCCADIEAAAAIKTTKSMNRFPALRP